MYSNCCKIVIFSLESDRSTRTEANLLISMNAHLDLMKFSNGLKLEERDLRLRVALRVRNEEHKFRSTRWIAESEWKRSQSIVEWIVEWTVEWTVECA